MSYALGVPRGEVADALFLDVLGDQGQELIAMGDSTARRLHGVIVQYMALAQHVMRFNMHMRPKRIGRTGRSSQSPRGSRPARPQRNRSIRPRLSRPVPPRTPRDWIQISVTALPGLAAVIALIFTWVSINATNFQLKIAEQGQITDRYNAAITNLGSGSVDVRLGGIYALQRIMQDSPRDQPTVVAVLCAFVRDHANVVTAKSVRYTTSAASAQMQTDVQAALTVVATRNTASDGDATVVDLSGTNLTRADLTDADLARADLTDSILDSAALGGADLSFADLHRVNLRDAILARANLSGAFLTGADLHGADLANANLTHTFIDGADLSGADLTGATGFRDVSPSVPADPTPSASRSLSSGSP